MAECDVLTGEPASVLALTITAVVACEQCGHGDQIVLLNAVQAACPSCGALIGLDAVTWSKDEPVPRVALSITPRSALVLP